MLAGGALLKVFQKLSENPESNLLAEVVRRVAQACFLGSIICACLGGATLFSDNTGLLIGMGGGLFGAVVVTELTFAFLYQAALEKRSAVRS